MRYREQLTLAARRPNSSRVFEFCSVRFEEYLVTGGLYRIHVPLTGKRIHMKADTSLRMQCSYMISVSASTHPGIGMIFI